MRIEPIGRVVEGYATRDEAPSQGRFRPRQRFLIELDPKLAPGLEGLREGSFVWVLLWFHKSGPAKLRVHPRGDRSRPQTGLFNSRSPNRPNPLGLDLGRIESIRGNVLEISGLDAVSGTPVVDLKPYIEKLDRPPGQEA